MPKRSSRPRDLNALAFAIMKEATGDAPASDDGKNPAAVSLGRLGGLKGGKARAVALSEQRRSEIATLAAIARWKKNPNVGDQKMALKWSKTLTRSDALQDTHGAKMPFLRFTKGTVQENHKKWFRETFFGDAAWSLDPGKGTEFEKTVVKMRVIIEGHDLGIRNIRIDHNPERSGNHSAPTTHLHYDSVIKRALGPTNLTGHRVQVRLEDGEYTFEVF